MFKQADIGDIIYFKRIARFRLHKHLQFGYGLILEKYKDDYRNHFRNRYLVKIIELLDLDMFDNDIEKDIIINEDDVAGVENV